MGQQCSNGEYDAIYIWHTSMSELTFAKTIMSTWYSTQIFMNVCDAIKQLSNNSTHLKRVVQHLISNVWIKIFAECKSLWKSCGCVHDKVEWSQRSKWWQQLFHLEHKQIQYLAIIHTHTHTHTSYTNCIVVKIYWSYSVFLTVPLCHSSATTCQCISTKFFCRIMMREV